MSRRPRRNYSPAFKAKVELEALTERPLVASSLNDRCSRPPVRAIDPSATFVISNLPPGTGPSECVVNGPQRGDQARASRTTLGCFRAMRMSA